MQTHHTNSSDERMNFAIQKLGLLPLSCMKLFYFKAAHRFRFMTMLHLLRDLITFCMYVSDSTISGAKALVSDLPLGTLPRSDSVTSNCMQSHVRQTNKIDCSRHAQVIFTKNPGLSEQRGTRRSRQPLTVYHFYD